MSEVVAVGLRPGQSGGSSRVLSAYDIQALWMLCRAIQGRAECPICRAPLKPGDLFDAATAEEEESQRLLNENMGNYGAKVPS